MIDKNLQYGFSEWLEGGSSQPLLDNKDKKMNDKFSFLLAPRFIALVIGALMFYLQTKNIVGEAEMILVNTILAGYITVRTIDRVSDKKVEAAEVAGTTTTVTMPSTVSKVTATTNAKVENTDY